jgi:hypothetical protein
VSDKWSLANAVRKAEFKLLQVMRFRDSYLLAASAMACSRSTSRRRAALPRRVRK